MIIYILMRSFVENAFFELCKNIPGFIMDNCFRFPPILFDLKY